MSAIPAGNVFDKHHSGNPVVRFLMDRFHACLRDRLIELRPGSILDTGCGEGYTTRVIRATLPEAGILAGSDLDAPILAAARRSCPGLLTFAASAGALPMPDDAFDLVIGCEMLEHLDDPEAALREMRRVSRGPCLFSVSWEPVWRALNVARGAYWSAWGNTPGHVNHWSRRRLRRLLEAHFTEVRLIPCWTWTFALCFK